jgi:MoaA/NifB/PqqE/SkfB family radical SAM enzyme
LFEELTASAAVLERINFAGGEPFMQPKQFELVDHLVATREASHIDLAYTTNLTLFPLPFIRRLSAFRSVAIIASCDGVGEVFERIRQGARWNRFVQNLDAALAEPHLRVSLTTSPQRANVAHLGELLEWAEHRGVDVDITNLVVYPRELSVQSLQADEKRRYAADLLELRNRFASNERIARGLDNLVGFMQAGPE